MSTHDTKVNSYKFLLRYTQIYEGKVVDYSLYPLPGPSSSLLLGCAASTREPRCPAAALAAANTVARCVHGGCCRPWHLPPLPLPRLPHCALPSCRPLLAPCCAAQAKRFTWYASTCSQQSILLVVSSRALMEPCSPPDRGRRPRRVHCSSAPRVRVRARARVRVRVRVRRVRTSMPGGGGRFCTKR